LVDPGGVTVVVLSVTYQLAIGFRNPGTRDGKSRIFFGSFAAVLIFAQGGFDGAAI
jgi:hypothetical protein